MTQIIKGQPKEKILKTILQIDEDGVGGIIIKSTALDNTSQMQLVLTRLEKMRLTKYFKEI